MVTENWWNCRVLAVQSYFQLRLVRVPGLARMSCSEETEPDTGRTTATQLSWMTSSLQEAAPARDIDPQGS